MEVGHNPKLKGKNRTVVMKRKKIEREHGSQSRPSGLRGNCQRVVKKGPLKEHPLF